MIVYREHRVGADPGEALVAILRRLDRLPRRPDHDTVIALLVDAGALEAGVADALAPACDEETAVTSAFRAAMTAAGHAVVASWHGHGDSLAHWCCELGRRLRACASLPLPAEVDIRVPEGFAHYGLYPECYQEAAEQLARELRPSFAVCLGIRSIGTALSAVVVAALEDDGCAVASYTIRPRGHPFDRRPVLGSSLRSRLALARDALFLVVDEGPGISGSSLVGTAEALATLGVPDERIALLPSWDPPAECLRSDTARRRWNLHRRYPGSFERTWLESGRMDHLLDRADTADLSAGRWRGELIPDPSRHPPVQPQHERRKLRTRGALLRFAGLGSVGQKRLARAGLLAEMGFTPHPARLAHGLLAQELVPGTPLARAEVDAELLDRMARYLWCLRERFAVAESDRTDVSEMMRVNLTEIGLERWAGSLEDPADGPPVAVDGRMLPHEWVRTARGYLKVDALDHHDDHFFPGPVDIAWDIAGATVEFAMSPEARQALVERYRRLSGDRTVAGRLPYYTVAYLACRIGYATLAAEVLGGTPDGRGFARMARRYEGMLTNRPPSSGAYA